jgi:hypothetical protein
MNTTETQSGSSLDPLGSVFRWWLATLIVTLLAIPLMIYAFICYAAWNLPDWPDIDQP